MKKTKKPQSALDGKPKTVGIDEISPNPWNYNEQSRFVFERQKLSIHDHGFIEPIIVRQMSDDSYQIIDGYHRWLAARELNYSTVPVIDLGKVSDAVAKSMTVTANELHGQPNEVKLSKLLVSLAENSDKDEMLEKLPYTQKDLERLVKLTSNLWDQPEEPKTPKAGGGGEQRDTEPETDHYKDLNAYSFVMKRQQFIEFQNTLKKVMEDTKSSEGRALELICADFLSSL